MNGVDAARHALASNPWTDSTRKGFEILRRAPPPACLLSVYLTSTHVTNLPGLSPPYLHTISDQILEVGQPGNEATVALLSQPMQG